MPPSCAKQLKGCAPKMDCDWHPGEINIDVESSWFSQENHLQLVDFPHLCARLPQGNQPWLEFIPRSKRAINGPLNGMGL